MDKAIDFIAQLVADAWVESQKNEVVMKFIGVCPVCKSEIVFVLPKENIHNLPGNKTVGISTSFSECKGCEKKGSKNNHFRVIITVALTQIDCGD